MTNRRWTHRPEGSNWGDFGPDDQLGRLNLITPEKVRQGVAEVSEGLSFCLSLPLDKPGGSALNPRRHPPILRPTLRGDSVNFLAASEDGAPDVLCDDLAIIHLQYSTQWDAFSHVGGRFDVDGNGVEEHVFYNGYRAGQDIKGPTDPQDAGVRAAMKGESTSHAGKLGVENAAVHGMQGRAVMIDLRAHYGDARTYVGYDELMRVLEADKVSVETGDMAVFHTGFAQRILEMATPDEAVLHGACAVLNGRDAKLLNWVTDSGVSALISDNYAVEGLPAQPCEHGHTCSNLPLHEHCLFKNGIPLGELWQLTPLADWLRSHGRSRFLLTAPPLRLPGAVGSPVTPIATV
ncbi:cyclase family protein [Pseudooceanicola sp.]|uniref:cyclase family protein n=1 Tax=Pseudooceanicola sp. TaxID=1914328 RepID=UPI0026031CF1|nr:cyclase family protein [Pseudooceanicola sp.]MDF1854624.1 cyclase family protein [Pseudooceanicola sp.]